MDGQFIEMKTGRPKLGLIWAMSEIPAKDLLLASYRVSDALPAPQTGPS